MTTQDSARPDRAPSATDPATGPAPATPDSPDTTGRGDAGVTPADPDDGRPHGGLGMLSLAALGVVFGDIGTSPLYSLQTVFSLEHNAVRVNELDVYGVISFVFWSITFVVTVKYVLFMLRADNEGEGGILALAALLKGKFTRSRRATSTTILLGVIGASLFYGDSVITPAISVMSAVEGLAVVNPTFTDLVLPISVGILTVLFVVQRWGTAVVGRAFGPVMILWFVTIAALGVPHIAAHPAIMRAVSPSYAVTFAFDRPFVAFVAMGAVVLSITGAEALYADMGHFGAKPIRVSWFGLVYPALIVNYFGQGAELLADPKTVGNPFFNMAPSWATLPLVVLATLATVIASQAVISGAYSVSQQAMRLGLLPRLDVRHTSKEEGGQIYVPAINWLLFAGVLVLILVFRSSSKLATAYGLSVTGTLLLTTGLFLVLARFVWRWNLLKCGAFLFFVGGAELTFFGANITKLITGGWIPLLIALVVVTVMLTWRDGAVQVTARRREMEGPLSEFLEKVERAGIQRVPGIAVFPHPNTETVPLALVSNVAFNRVLHENVIILTMTNAPVPHIRHVDRVTVDDLGNDHDGIAHVDVRIGFNDNTAIPAALDLVKGRHGDVTIDPDAAHYFVSALDVHRGGDAPLAKWRKLLFLLLRHNAADAAKAFKLPPDRTVVMGNQLRI